MVCEDIAVYLINSQEPPRPGFDYENQIILENLASTSVSSGTVEFVHDELLTLNGILEMNPNYSFSTTANGLSIDFVDLAPGEIEIINISLNCPAGAELGDIVTSSVSYFTDEDDIDDSNNISSLSEEVVGSFDPNDKMESHGPQIIYDDFVSSDEYFYYTIRFQNLGTFAADFIRIEDELDAQLDESTFQMLRSSHDYVVTRTGNDLEWFFQDIQLPAAQDDEEGSNGYVYFKIKPKAGYSIGDVIPNTASIFFDFNDPIITNTFQSEFVETLSAEQFAFNAFSLSPNPAKDIVAIKMKNNNFGRANVNIFDVQGKQILKATISEENPTDLDVSELKSGLYFVKINSGQFEAVKKLIIK